MPVFLEDYAAGVAVGKVHLQQCPLFLSQFSGGEKGAERNELAMPLGVHRHSSRWEIVSSARDRVCAL